VSARVARVLLVEDHEIVRELIASTLGDGYDVVGTDRGHEALDLLVRRDFDVVVLDLSLEGELSGRDIYRRLLTLRPEVAERVVFCTGDSFSEDTQEFLDDAGCPVLWKPFDLEELRTTIAATAARG
jgi:CheY-like chemotaxis protein